MFVSFFGWWSLHDSTWLVQDPTTPVSFCYAGVYTSCQGDKERVQMIDLMWNALIILTCISQLAHMAVSLNRLFTFNVIFIMPTHSFRCGPASLETWRYLEYMKLSHFLIMYHGLDCWRRGARKKRSGGIMAVAIPRILIETSRRGRYWMSCRCAATNDPRRVPALSLMFQVMRFGYSTRYRSTLFRSEYLIGSSTMLFRDQLVWGKWLWLIRRYWMISFYCSSGVYDRFKISVPLVQSCKRSEYCFEINCPGCE